MDARMGRERGLPPSRCAIAVSRTLQVPGLPAGDSAHIQVAMTHTASGDAQSQPTGLTHPCICPLSRPYHSHRNRRKSVVTLLRSERRSPSQQGRPASDRPFQCHPDAGPTSAGAKVTCALKPRSSGCPSRTVTGRRRGPAGHQPPRANTVGPHPQMAGGRGGVPSALHDAAGHGLQR